MLSVRRSLISSLVLFQTIRSVAPPLSVSRGLGRFQRSNGAVTVVWRIVLEFETSGSFMWMLRGLASVLAEENVPPSSVKVLVRGRTHTLSRLLGVNDEI